MSPFGASAHTLLTLGVEWAGGFVFKAWEEHKERMAAARRSGLEEGLERGREEGREEGRAEMREEYERRLARFRQAVMERTGQDLDVLLNGNDGDTGQSRDNC